MTVAGPSFDHLLAISDRFGTFEHAALTVPRPGHGYCADDVARVVVVTSREPEPNRAVAELARRSVRFLSDAQGVGGHLRNRRTSAGRWVGRRGTDDCWGRALWAFGTAAASPNVDPMVAQTSLPPFERGLQVRSRSPRAMAFAALGAAEVLAVDPRHLASRSLLADAITTIGPLGPDPAWPWPEARLAYANAALAEALVVAGHLLGRPEPLADGLTMLRWLLDRETVRGHLSPTPVGGAGPGDVAPAFDQQPIEVAALADACARAATVTGDPGWLAGVEVAIAWFEGANDVGDRMFDPASGGGYDGLHARGPNLNQGAESTLALVSTLQHAHRLAVASP